jgi:hypothetical protein
MYFLTFFYVSTADTNAFFTVVQPPLEGSGKVIFGEHPHNPLPLCLELVQGHGEPRQLSLQRGEEKVVSWGQVRQVRGVGNHLNLLFHQELLNFLHGVHLGVVPLEHPLSGLQIRPFQVESLEKVLHGLDDVVSVDSGSPGT